MQWDLENIYSQMPGTLVPRSNYLKIIGEGTVGKPQSRPQLAAKIAAFDINLTAGASSKDIRIQPVAPISNDIFFNAIKNAGLSIVDAKKPGEEGSTSGQLVTYIVADENGHQYAVVLGKGKGFGTRHEDFIIIDLREQITTEISNSALDHIVIDVNGYKQKVNGVESTPGTPKSDLEFTFNGKPVIFISHKAGRKPTDHQQYGGMTNSSGTNISNHPEVIEFTKALKSHFSKGMPAGVSVHRKIIDDRLKQLSVFGNDFGKEFGINNVNALYQGDMKLKKGSSNNYVIESPHVVFNGEIPTGAYDPFLTARFSGSRGGNHGIKDLRSAISPKAKISSNSKAI